MMRRGMVKYVGVGVVLALVTVGLAWVIGVTGAFNTDRWRIVSLFFFGAEIIFLLFIPGNKGGQQFGPRGGPAGSPPVTSGAEFYDRYPARRLGDWRWMFIGVPLVVAAIGVVVSFMF